MLIIQATTLDTSLNPGTAKVEERMGREHCYVSLRGLQGERWKKSKGLEHAM
jgi:hypothetical protein